MELVRFLSYPVLAKNGICHLDIWRPLPGVQKTRKEIGKHQHPKAHTLIAVASSCCGLDHPAPGFRRPGPECHPGLGHVPEHMTTRSCGHRIIFGMEPESITKWPK